MIEILVENVTVLKITQSHLSDQREMVFRPIQPGTADLFKKSLPSLKPEYWAIWNQKPQAPIRSEQ